MFAKYYELISQTLGTLTQGNAAALAALFLVLALGEWGVPFPFVLQGVLFFIGYQASHGAVIHVLPLAVILVSGRQFGASALYWLARLLGNPFVSWFERRFRHLKGEAEKLKVRLSSRAPVVVAASRLTPGLLVPTSVASGIVSLRYEYFALGVTLSAVVWDGTFIALGIVLGHGAQRFSWTNYPWFIAIGFALVVCLAWFAGRLLVHHRWHERPAGYEDTAHRKGGGPCHE
jgi:membrane protein DedA with SNARE-associated domain